MSKASKLSILVVDDERLVRDYLYSLLKDDYEVYTAASSAAAVSAIKQHSIDLVLLDILLGDRDSGLALLKKLRQIDEDLDIIVISGVQMVQTVVSAIQQGASDYINKPIEPEALFLAIRKTIEKRRLKASHQVLREQIDDNHADREIVGQAPSILKVKEMISQLQHQSVNVFIVGDTGTGKEMFARQIHTQEEDTSRPFVSVNCAAIPETLIESILFGHEKGSFTNATERKLGKFELAHGGDIFLDEISCLSPELQAKLLRVIEEKEVERIGGTISKRVDFRVISACNEDVLQLVAEGKFRKDLFYRLNTVTIRLPTLAERKEDIIPLAEHFLHRYRRTQAAKQLSDEVKEILLQHSWRGNVRELKNTIENMIIFSKGEVIEADDLKFAKTNVDVPTTRSDLNQPNKETVDEAISFDGSYHDIVQEVERRLLLQYLEKNRWNKSRTSREVGMKRNKLYRKLAELGIE